MVDKSTSRGGGKGRPPGGGKGRTPGGFGKGGSAKGRPPGGRSSAPRGRAGTDKSPREDRPKFERGERPAFAKGPRAEGQRNERPAFSRGPRSERPERSAADRPATGRFRDGVRADSRPRRERERPEARTENRPFTRREDRGRSDATRPTAAPNAAPREGERIAKVMARVGLCSRRDAEDWILAGRVSVNGETLTSPALDVTQEDDVLVDGEKLPMRERTRLFLYHKERGLVTTARDPEGRPTVFEALPPDLPRVITVGRLDINTEGLLLLTNDGGLARIMELPETGWLRRYRVRCYGEIDQAALDSLKRGVTVEGMHYGPIEATLDREKGDNVWLTLGLREGKNREVKRVLEHLGLQVNRLIRLSFGPFQLGDLPEGAVEEVRTSFLKDQLGPGMIEESGVDFDAPVFVYEEEPEPLQVEEKPRRYRERESERAERTLEEPDHRGRPDRARGKGPRPSRPQEPMRGGDRKSFTTDSKSDDTRSARRHPTEPKRSIWRADDVESGPSGPKMSRSPRRGADPVAARLESGERKHERAGRVTSSSGRTVKVEKILSTRVRNDAPWDMERVNKASESVGVRERKPRSEFSSDRNADRRPERANGPRSRDDTSSRSSRPPREGKPFGDRNSPRDGEPFGDRKPTRDGKPPRSGARPARDGAPSRPPRGGSGSRPPRGGSGGRPPRSRG